MRLIVAGSRGITDRGIVEDAISYFEAKYGVVEVIVSGTARGVDRLGEEVGEKRGLVVDRYPAEWDRYGRSAGYRRNELMAKNADGLVAVWDGVSKGTGHMIDLARKHGLIVLVWKAGCK